MATVRYCFEVRDAGLLKSGLTPSFLHFKKLADGTAITAPTVSALGNGQYTFAYDPEALGEASAVVDAGPGVASGEERYFGLVLTLERSRIQGGLSAAGKVTVATVEDKAGFALAPTGLDLVEAEAGVPLPVAVSRIAAATAGTSSGGGTGTITYFAMAHPGTPRVVGQVSLAGNRTAVTYP